MAGTLFNSKIIKHEIREKYKMILDLYQLEVHEVIEIFGKKYIEFKEAGCKVKLIVFFSSIQ